LNSASDRIGVVAIGRNEGKRLARCLESLLDRREAVIYVDSGSHDDSVEQARALGIHVVDLDDAQPFTAARARNAGFEDLSARLPDLEFVQFVDGDSELQSSWIPAAIRYLASHHDVAAVCGNLYERNPQANAYHRLASIEWNQPAGDTPACGGIAMYRASVFRQLGGFAESMIAGEEPDLCLRLRDAGHRIVHLDLEMAVHESSMTQFRQWWRRGLRSGHAFADIAYRRGIRVARLEVRQLASVAFWGGMLVLIPSAARSHLRNCAQ
jgi:GT2 family glycosyltransferase